MEQGPSSRDNSINPVTISDEDAKRIAKAWGVALQDVPNILGALAPDELSAVQRVLGARVGPSPDAALRDVMRQILGN